MNNITVIKGPKKIQVIVTSDNDTTLGECVLQCSDAAVSLEIVAALVQSIAARELESKEMNLTELKLKRNKERRYLEKHSKEEDRDENGCLKSFISVENVFEYLRAYIEFCKDEEKVVEGCDHDYLTDTYDCFGEPFEAFCIKCEKRKFIY